jgi:RNA polymerase sigma factor (TIGR02999 family)
MVEAAKRSEDPLSGSMVRAYDELRRLARRYLSAERLDHTLQATALVHETYLRLSRGPAASWQGRRHFFNLAAREMRRVLIEHARGHGAARRGGAAKRVLLEEVAAPAAVELDANLVAVDDALNALAAVDRRKARVVELRFFGGMTIAETAELLGVSTVTVIREWRLAKAWLYRELRQGGGDESPRVAAARPPVPDRGRPRAG